MSAADHVAPDFGPAELENAAPEERAAALAHLAECSACAATWAAQAEAWSTLALALEPVEPPAALWERVQGSLAGASRFEHLVARASQLLDLSVARVRELFAGIEQSENWVPSPWEGLSLFHIDPGPRRASALAGFVRLAPGTTFPEHRHLGPEEMLVLQGSLTTSDGLAFRAGGEFASQQGHVHSFTARPGPDLIYLGVTENGLEIGGLVMVPGDPRV